MAEIFTGPIIPSLEKPLQEVFDFSDEDLGICWVSRSKDGGSTSYSPKSINNSEERDVIIPADDGALFTTIEAMVRKAEEMVCLSSFLIQRSRITEALLEATGRGVEVFVLTAREDDLKKADTDLVEFERERIEDHIALLDQFAGQVLVRTSESFHAKYILVDPLSPDASGIMMTCNATVEPMSGSNIEVALTLTPSEVRSFFAHFIKGFWTMADHELLEQGELSGVKRNNPSSINFGKIDLPATVGEIRSLEERVLAMIRGAEKELILAAWSFDSYGPVHEAVMDACRRGVRVTILTRPNARNTNSLKNCARFGARVLAHPRLHAKCVIADARTGLIMTANMTELGLATGFETAVPLEGRTLGIILKIIEDWMGMCGWSLKAHVTPATADGSILQLSEDGRTLNERIIIPMEKRGLRDFRPNSCEKILGYTVGFRKEVDKIRASEQNKVFRQITVEQKAVPPYLPEGVRGDAQSNVRVPVFRKGKDKYVVVQTWEEVFAAQEHSQQLNAIIVVRGDSKPLSD